MTREEAIAEAEHRQASDPDASWIVASRDGEWAVVRIVKPDAFGPQPPPPRLAERRSKSLGSGIWGGTPLGGI